MTRSTWFSLERELGSPYRPKSPGESFDHMLRAGFATPQKRKYSKSLRTIAFKPIFEASVLTVAKRNSDMPIKADDPTIA